MLEAAKKYCNDNGITKTKGLNVILEKNGLRFIHFQLCCYAENINKIEFEDLELMTERIETWAELDWNLDIEAKVQTNKHSENVLVQTEKSDNRHYSHLNRAVLIQSVLTDEEIIKVWKNRDENDDLKLAKDWIVRQDGYASSNCIDKIHRIKYGTIVKFKE